MEEHLRTIEQGMVDLPTRETHFLTTVTSISVVTVRASLGELDSVSRFERPEQPVPLRAWMRRFINRMVSTVTEPGFPNEPPLFKACFMASGFCGEHS